MSNDRKSKEIKKLADFGHDTFWALLGAYFCILFKCLKIAAVVFVICAVVALIGLIFVLTKM